MYRDELLLNELAVYVKQLRNKYQYTQEQLAELAGVDQRQITRLETSKNWPQVNKLEMILKPLETNADAVYQEIAKIRIQFDNQIKRVNDLIFNVQWDEAALITDGVAESFSNYQHIAYYLQGILFLKASMLHRLSWEESVSIYIEALKVTQESLLLGQVSEQKIVAVSKLETSVLAELEYCIMRQIATGLGCLGNHTHAIEICQALLGSFENPAVSRDIKKLLAASICASIAWLYSELSDTKRANYYISQGIAYCNETGNTRSLEYLKNLELKLRNSVSSIGRLILLHRAKKPLA